jgi:hypothetical protein
MYEVREVRPLPDYRLHVEFADGTEGEVDTFLARSCTSSSSRLAAGGVAATRPARRPAASRVGDYRDGGSGELVLGELGGHL